MKLSPREQESLLVHQVGSVAQKRLARGVRLNYTEAVALIASQVSGGTCTVYMLRIAADNTCQSILSFVSTYTLSTGPTIDLETTTYITFAINIIVDANIILS